MPINYKYDKEKDAIFCAVIGEFVLDEFKLTMEKIVNSKEFPPNTRTLWDLRKIDIASINKNIENAAISIRKQFPGRESAKLALVSESDFVFGMSRMYEMLSENSELPQQIKVFRTYSEAEKWLLSE